MKHGNVWRDRKKPRRYVYDKDCKMKSRFTDEVQARAGAAVAMDTPRNGEKRAPVRLWVYRCPHCFGWHMTSRDRGGRWLVERVRKRAA